MHEKREIFQQIFKFKLVFHKSYMTTEEYSEYCKYVWTTFKVQSFLWNFTCKNGQFSNYDELIKTQVSYQKAFFV